MQVSRTSKEKRGQITFAKCIKPLRKIVPKIARQMDIGEFSKKLTPLEHIKLMVHQVIEDKETLTELCMSTKSKVARARELVSISKPQLSTVNNTWDYRMFVWVFYELVYRATRKYHSLDKVKKGLRLMGLDSTFIILKAPFSRRGYSGLTKKVEEGIKLHLVALLGRLTVPITLMVTPGNVADSLEFEDLAADVSVFMDMRQVILVFDKAYWKYTRFKWLALDGIRFIIPMKKGAKYTVISEKKTEKWCDQIILIGGAKLRLVTIYEADEELRYLTSVFDLSPDEIKECYDARWDMEVLIKEFKQHLNIKKFIGKSLNAVLVQIFCTMIAYLLMVLYKIERNLAVSVLEIKRAVMYGVETKATNLNELPDYAIGIV